MTRGQSIEFLDRRINDLEPEKIVQMGIFQVMLETSAVSDLLAAVEDEEGQLWESKEGDSGKVAKLWVEFLKAEDAFKYFVLLSASNFQTAIALLKAVTDSTQLTDAEHDRVNCGCYHRGQDRN